MHAKDEKVFDCVVRCYFDSGCECIMHAQDRQDSGPHGRGKKEVNMRLIEVLTQNIIKIGTETRSRAARVFFWNELRLLLA